MLLPALTPATKLLVPSVLVTIPSDVTDVPVIVVAIVYTPSNAVSRAANVAF